MHAAEEKDGAIGVLVNNAGYGQEGAIEELPMEKIRVQFETNVFGLVRLTQLVLSGMRRQRWGKIVNVSSMGGKLTLPGGGAYHASKHALEAVSDALRFEARPFGIDVVVIEPGPIRTAFGDTAGVSLSSLPLTSESPYRRLNAVVARMLEDGYRGRMAVFAGSPESVARTIERAITARRPKPRYVVTAVARMLLGMKWLLSDRAFDKFLSLQLKTLGY